MRILHLEDSPRDAEIIRERLLDSGFSLQLDLAANEQQFTAFLKSGSYDLILADYHLPAFEGEEALRLSKLYCPDAPFICVSGAIGEIKAVALLKQGATDYVSKNMLDKLSISIVRALDEEWERNERRLAEDALLKSEERFRQIAESTEEWIWEVSNDGLYTYSNYLVEKILGYKAEEVVGKMHFFDFFPSDKREQMKQDAFAAIVSKSILVKYVNENVHKDGRVIIIETSGAPILNSSGDLLGYRGVDIDITEYRKLEAELLQAQKMESVGQLAGGVAHDFNNMLGVILGNSEMALMNMESSHPLFDKLMEIHKAAERSADLTRQLLAFARKQTVQPKVLNLNENLSGMLKMLQRLIGENIQLSMKSSANLWQLKMDPTQLDQIIANLCINARDSISDSGLLTIETSNIVCNESDCSDHAGFVPGEYVLLSISDNGCGMDKSTRERIFEPFFTTKEVGQGTGLGLATVYGIIKQNNGFINVYSEPGHGTTFRIYLPRYAAEDGQPTDAIEEEIPVCRGETVLLVEDEPTLLILSKLILEELGYAVLTAATPDEAIRTAQVHSGPIQLLMTDVIMPEMNGRKLAEKIRPSRPEMKCLFMSGYTADVIAQHGVLEEGIQFIQKPFSIKALAMKVRETLGS